MKVLMVAIIIFSSIYCSNQKENTTQKQLTSPDRFATLHKTTKVRKFEVDYENDEFIMDDSPFRFISGSFHYFRAMPETWQRKLRTMRAAGLNTVSTSVEWSLHNPEDNVYNFDGIADLEEFIKLAAQEGLYVILRIGPYIGADRDYGGIPYWLHTKYPGVQLRTFEPNFQNEVSKWFKILLPKIHNFLYGNGGPIILLQLEHSYGSFENNNQKYKNWLRDEVSPHVSNRAILFTADDPKFFAEGKIKDVIGAFIFQATSNEVIDSYWKKLKFGNPHNPLINMEFNTGSPSYWQERMVFCHHSTLMKALDKMLRDGANINFYMFVGGTNYGFSSGASNVGVGKYSPYITSYDYDAPIDESGDVTPKYFAIKEILKKYVAVPNITVIEKTKKTKLKDIKMQPICSLLEKVCQDHLKSYTIKSVEAKSFDMLEQNTGFILYETMLPISKRDPTRFAVNFLKDRAYIYVNKSFVEILSRENAINNLPLSLSAGNHLQVLLENEGRLSLNFTSDRKGLFGYKRYGYKLLKNWIMTGFPFDNYTKIENLIRSTKGHPEQISIENGPVLFHAEFFIEKADLFDTYLDTSQWGKGIVFINGFNIGRFWAIAGPQMTLYIPKEILVMGTNKITILELQNIPSNYKIQFSNKPIVVKSFSNKI